MGSSDTRILGILPAAGLATRMGGLPKFLLPTMGDYSSLLDRHVEEMLQVVAHVVIPTRPEHATLLGRYGDRAGVTLMCMTTRTMSETVIRVHASASADGYVLGMPDTYFHGDSPYGVLADSIGRGNDLALALWNIRPAQRGKLGQVQLDSANRVTGSRDKDPECDFPWSWGALAYRSKVLDLLDPQSPHIGYAIQPAIDASLRVLGYPMGGKYFDCGTPSEYREVLELRPRLGAGS
jgi:hypothetical protein